MKQKFFLGLLLALAGTVIMAQENNGKPTGKVLYENNFEKAELDKVPSDFLVITGEFAVKQEGTNKFLELPGAPLDTFGFLFGPTSESDIVASARIRGSSKGRRFPTFAIGLNGVSGYWLQVSPAKKVLELLKTDEVVATAPFEEKIGAWMKLRLQLSKISETEWKVEGKVWIETSREPEKAQIIFAEKTKPVAGRASIWGSPYAGTPIQFDDLKVISLEAAR